LPLVSNDFNLGKMITTAYDAVQYPGHALAQAHPDRLATLASLFGVLPPIPAASRILELGCGDGVNLISLASALPRAACIGIDLATSGIRKGQVIAERLRVRNVEFKQFDFMDVGEEFGKFDYIIAHGIYSWIPAAVRDKLLAICKANLSENGVAYVSYNTYPGCHLRQMIRGMMKYHVSEMDTPQQKIEQGRALVKFLAESSTDEPDFYRSILAKEYRRVSQQLESSVFHDDLADTNHPVYFHQFVDHAARHGLQYLSEAQFFEMQSGIFSSEAVDVINQISDSRVAKEQYLDFLKCRSFRQTLLVHKEQSLDLDVRPERVMKFYVASPIRPQDKIADLGSQEVITFVGPEKSSLKIDKPVIKAALVALGNAWPRAVQFDDLLSRAQYLLDESLSAREVRQEEDRRALAEVLLRAYAAGIVEFHVHPPQFVTSPSERPVASPLARLQAQNGDKIVNLRHHNIKIEDSLGRGLLQLLDGTRDRSALVASLSELVNSGKASLPEGGIIPNGAKGTRDIVEANLEENLISLGRMALLAA
jgi:methyltransferase-like protein/cyclopropane fatty-acyl-phospholipid synthase-like methyltransferase